MTQASNSSYFTQRIPNSFKWPIRLYTIWLFLNSSPLRPLTTSLCSDHTGPLLCQEHSLALSSLGTLYLLLIPSIFYLLGFLLYQKCFKALFKSSLFQTLLTYFNIACSPYHLYFLWPSNILYFTYLHPNMHSFSHFSKI